MNYQLIQGEYNEIELCQILQSLIYLRDIWTFTSKPPNTLGINLHVLLGLVHVCKFGLFKPFSLQSFTVNAW